MRVRQALLGAGALCLVVGTAGAVGLPGNGNYPYHADISNEPAPLRTIMFVGDSITDQAAGAIKALGEQRGDTIDVWAKPGDAACDFSADYADHLTTTKPSEVSIEFVGNARTPCMVGNGPAPGVLTQAQQDAVATKYYLALRAMVSLDSLRGIRTWLVVSPTMAAGTFHGQVTDELTARITQLAHDFPHTYLDTGARDLLTPGGTYRRVLRFGGVDHPIRSRDGIHLGLPYGTTLYAEAVLASTAQAPS